MTENDTSSFERQLATLMRREVGGISPARIEQRVHRAVAHRRRIRTLRTSTVAACLLLVTGGLFAAEGLRGGPARHHPGFATTTVPPTTAVHLAGPLSRMRGLVQVMGVAFPSSSDGVVLLQQCWPCQATTGTYTNWVAVTSDGGSSWQVHKTDMPVRGKTRLSFTNAADGWADNGWYTHDGGLTWHKAAVPAGALIDSVSVAGGTVWAESAGCSAANCASGVFIGPATGSSLTPVADQVLGTGYAPGTIFAVSASTAYLDAEGPHGNEIVATDDGGRSWRTVASPCPAGDYASRFMAVAPSALWQFCQKGITITTPTGTAVKGVPGGRAILARSGDGGRHWTSAPVSTRLVGELEPWSLTTSWVWTLQLARTTDGGGSWTTVWSAPPPGKGETVTPEAFSSESASVAEIPLVVASKEGSYVIVERTTDAGASWHPTTISLPDT
ncbi:MAG TPA: hypothetical protein VFN50_05860 [Acidimicrobiales bacterium]|nr:hypothetical protein [Acidimicrobiales bacterium]